MKAITVFLVEDDVALAMGTEYSLKSEGMEVICARDSEQARMMWKESRERIDLVLLDVMLPDGDGYELCQWLKQQNAQVPILFLTALADEGNVVRGLNIGGDDYITKPFRTKELIARIHANLRKEGKERKNGSVLKSGRLVLDRESFAVYLDQEKVDLTLSEFRLLLELMSNAGQIMTREKLMEKLWMVDEAFVDDNTLSVYIRRLREKIDVNREDSYITTVRGLGYRFE